MSGKVHENSAHGAGSTFLAFSRDGSHVYTGGADMLARIWDTKYGQDQDPMAAVEASEDITTLAVGSDCWLSGSKDSEVRKYGSGKKIMDSILTSANGVAIRCIAVDPKGKRVAVTSDEPTVKVIDLEDTTKVMILAGHTKAVRKATWHPSGALLTTSGADGKVVVYDVSGEEPKVEKVIDGIIPAVADSESPEFDHDCSAMWHASGQTLYMATRTHEIAAFSKSTWAKTSTLSDDACTGAITALALSNNGVYLAAASKSGVFIWSTQTRTMLYRFQGAMSAPVTQMAFSPTQNMLAWTDVEGKLIRWHDPIPASAADPVKLSGSATSVTMPAKRKTSPTLFDDDVDLAKPDEDIGIELDDDLDPDRWVVDDMDGALLDDPAKTWDGEGGVREMVSVTKAQPAFQPGSTPMDMRKRYLAYNMVGVIEVTDQDTHHVVNVEFHDRSARKSHHFTDHFKYDIASLGERGALYACPPEADHLAHVMYKPYSAWAGGSSLEWTYELPKGTKALGIAAGGPPPMKSMRNKSDLDIQGHGNVVVATDAGELIFLTGSGMERCVLSLQGDFVTMVAGTEWVFVVTRDGSTSMDGSQNLTGRLIKFDDFCLLQKDVLPIPKRHTLKWVGITEEGAPAIYDSAGVLNLLPRFRIPLSATWTRVLDTNTLDRREGKDESYWPVGVSGDTFMCLILKGRQEHPGFPRPLIQELPLRLPFKRNDPKETPLEEHFSRETMLLDILRDGLSDEDLTTDDITRRELALDKELIQLIQSACKADKQARALDLTRLLHLTPSFDMAVKVAGFYRFVGLQEKIEALKDAREAADRLEENRDRRRQRRRDFAAVPAYARGEVELPRAKAFQDFRPPPAMHRPGLERATPSMEPPRQAPVPASSQFDLDSQPSVFDDLTAVEDSMDTDYAQPSPEGKRKRAGVRESSPLGMDGASKRRATESISTPGAKMGPPAARSNPFARKPGAEKDRNPFARTLEGNKSLHKSESFFAKVDAAETDKGKRAAPGKGKGKEKREGGKQTTLFGLPPVHAAEKEKKAPGRKKKAQSPAETEPEQDTQTTDVVMEDTQTETDTQVDDEPSQVPTETEDATPAEDAASPIEWPPSPEPAQKQLEAAAA